MPRCDEDFDEVWKTKIERPCHPDRAIPNDSIESDVPLRGVDI